MLMVHPVGTLGLTEPAAPLLQSAPKAAERELQPPAVVPVGLQIPKLAELQNIRAVRAVPVVGQAQILPAVAPVEEQPDQTIMEEQAALQILPPKMAAAVAAMTMVSPEVSVPA
jgi:hypothetical protein